MYTRYVAVLSFFLITLTALLVYSNTFHAPFLLDDRTYILENQRIRDLGNFLNISGTRYVGFLSFALNYYFGGSNVFSYHVINIIIHVMNGLLVWLLVVLTFETPVMENASGDPHQKYFIGLAASLIFISHPVQTQAVTYITQRFASFATLFFLLSLILFIKWRGSGGPLNPAFKTTIYVVSLLSAVLAMKTKEISFTLPFVILLYEFAFFNGKTLKERLFPLIPFILTLTIIPFSLIAPEFGLAERESYLDGSMMELQLRELTTLNRYDYLVTQLRVVVTYIRLLFLPINQNIDYDYPIYNSLFELEIFLSFLFVLSVFGLAIYLFARSRKTNNGSALLASFGILWFFITLSVESSIIPIMDVIFEHRLYLPSVGAVIAFASALYYGFDYAKERLEIKVSPLIFACLLLLVISVPLGLAAHNRNWLWKDELALLEDSVKKSPYKPRAHLGLGLAFAERGRLEKAVEEYKKALKLKPDYVQAHNNLGVIYFKQGRIKEAAGEYKEALRLNPALSEAHYNLGIILYRKGNLVEAIKELKEAVRIDPDFAKPHLNIAIIYDDMGLLEEALKWYTKTIELAPADHMAYNNMGIIYGRKKEYEKAIELFKKALEIRPDDKTALKNFSLAREKLQGE
jgi:tetratricopeptide (TPR) repeat protein